MLGCSGNCFQSPLRIIIKMAVGHTHGRPIDGKLLLFQGISARQGDSTTICVSLVTEVGYSGNMSFLDLSAEINLFYFCCFIGRSEEGKLN